MPLPAVPTCDSNAGLLAANILHPTALRAELEDLVIKDLLGPAGGPDEEIVDERVSDRYLLGILSPKRVVIAAAEDEPLSEGGDSAESDGATDDVALPIDTLAPASIGLTFTVSGECSQLAVTPRWGRYAREKSETATTDKGNPKVVWKRYPMGGKPLDIAMAVGDIAAIPADVAQADVVIKGRVRKLDNDWVVSLFLVNAQQIVGSRPKDDELIFQPELEVAASDGSAVFHKRSRRAAVVSDEQRHLEMLYRQHVEFASGHGVAVEAVVSDNPSHATRLFTKVIPTYEVPVTTPPTAQDNPDLTPVVLDMQRLAAMPDAELFASLRALNTAYGNWVAQNQARVNAGADGLGDYKDTARQALQDCGEAQTRIEAGIALLESDPQALRAFRFANQAMWQQRIHAQFAGNKRAGIASSLEELNKPENHSWRPFQLAFVLLNLPGITRLDHADRGATASAIADLLWFPTGGGKTEAYLGLTAYTLAMRRLQGVVGGRLGHAGVAVIMRYTLRLLTLQQFQRAAALICACEVIRRADAGTWGGEPFRIGLWVGNRTTPNSIEDAHEAVLRANGAGGGGGSGTPLQLTNCPWCGEGIRAAQDVQVETYKRGRARVFTFCGDELGRCDFSRAKSPDEGIPVLTVDEEIYRRLPALLISTVDKFAQMPWNGKTQVLFGQVDGFCPRHGFTSPSIEDATSHINQNGFPAVRKVDHGPLRPPDLIIQDELHLISGPLGSLVGLYETAVDQLCTWSVDGHTVRPKVIASTATIRQASQQIRALFLRDVRVFPPQGIDIEDNFFSVQRAPSERYPGRRYMGVASFGRRQKLAMIRVYVAFLAAGKFMFDKYGKAVDPWLTLLGYFNSMRELGGMRRLVDDDVRVRLRDMESRGLAKRSRPVVEELTSRKNSRDIPGLLDWLEVQHDPALPPYVTPRPRGYKGRPPLDVVLATNMVSVGVDIRRLGLMVMTGQPKGTSEYIQASSRVGRNADSPGLVCTVYNWARPRDLSHYERFSHYHATFYQHVEALSVTPFARRAVDRGLAAVLTSLVRLPSATYNDNAMAGQVDRTSPLVQAALAGIAHRATEVTQSNQEGQRVQSQLQQKMDVWVREAAPKPGGARLGYRKSQDGLTLPLLKNAGIGDWEPFTCLGSLRDVEPSVNLLLDDRPLDDGYGQGYNAPVPAAPATPVVDGSDASNGGATNV